MGSATEIRLAQHQVEHCMGTVFSIDVREPGVDRSVIDTVIAWLHWADDTFSTYQPSSDISQLRQGKLSVADCAPEVGMILQRCRELQGATSGYFSAYADGTLDPSGLVKGCAIQRASDMLRASGSLNHCVNGGGDVICVGDAEPGQPWRIGIAHPLQPDQLAGIAAGQGLSGNPFAVATSGIAERGCHITDPHTGLTPTGLASVTLIGTDLATTDAYATAAFAMGRAAVEWVSTLAGYQALIVFADGTSLSTTAIVTAGLSE